MTLHYLHLCRILTPVRVVKVIPPSPPPTSPLKSPSRPSLDTTSTPHSPALPQSKENSIVPQPPKAVSVTEVDHSDEHVVSNGLAPLNDSDKSTPAKPVFKSPKTPRTPLTPLSSEVSLKPEDYRYVVREVGNPEKTREVKGGELCRPKGIFTTNKLKILFRIALGRKSEKHPFIVKVCMHV